MSGETSRGAGTALGLTLLCCHLSITIAADKVAPITALVTIQESEGMTETDLDTASLKRLEQWLVERTLQRAKQNYARQGFDPKSLNPKIDIGSVYALAGGKKLAVIRMTMDNQVRTVWVMGFHRGDFLRVTCVRESDHDIPLFSGECGQKITEAFGVSIKPQMGATAPASPTGTTDLDLNTQMIEAARSGNLADVTTLVAKGADVNAKTSFGYSALSGASGKGHTQVVRFLLDKGVNVNERLRGGTNALDEASFSGHAATVRLLLARGANPNMKKDNGYRLVASSTPMPNFAIGITEVFGECYVRSVS